MNLDLTGFGSVAELANGIVNRIWPDATEADKAKLALALAEINAELEKAKGQMQVNQAEASGNWFVSGWRPAVGWICVLGLFYQFFLQPISVGLGSAMPLLQADTLMTLLAGILGLGAYRSIERVKGAIPPGR